MRRSGWLVLLAALLPSAGFATQQSCPPLGTLPGYVPEEARLRSFETLDLRQKAQDGDGLDTVRQAGRTCKIVYNIESGKDPMSDLEIQSNYREQLRALGAEIVGESDGSTWARLTKDGEQTWMGVESQENSIWLQTVTLQPPKLTLLPAAASDYPALGHMPDYEAEKPRTRNFDQLEFKVAQGDDQTRTIKAQGRTFQLVYSLRSGAQAVSDEEIQFNYRDALTKLGAEILYTAGGATTARLTRNGQVVWASIESQETGIFINVVEEKLFESSIKPPPPGELRSTLDKAGHVALYLNFDFAQATLRPESNAVLAQVAAMLKADPALKLRIEGHTDNLGTAEFNQRLSQDRAAAVLAYLSSQGIAPGRLEPAGLGADKPVATNDTSDGRARNRRVELVKM